MAPAQYCETWLAAVLLVILWSTSFYTTEPAALIAGALFALHPAQAESVAWIAVPDPLMTSAVLVCLLFIWYTWTVRMLLLRDSLEKPKKKSQREAQARSAAATVWWLIASAACCLAALFTKETAIVLPFVIFVVAFSLPRASFGKKSRRKPRGGARTRLVFAFRESWPYPGGHGHLSFIPAERP